MLTPCRTGVVRVMYLTGLLLSALTSQAQDTSALASLPGKMQQKYAGAVNAKVETFNGEVQQATEKTLSGVIRQEKKMQSKVARIDSVKARLLFKYSIDSLQRFETLIKSKTGKIGRIFGARYFPYLDTLKQSLSFIKKAQGIADSANQLEGKLNTSMNSVDQMESRLATVEQLNTFLTQREAVLQSQLSSFPGISSNLLNVEKQAYYYQTQVAQYKSTLSDPEKIEKLALNTLEKAPFFQKFVQQNGQLAGLFASPPGSGGIPDPNTPAAGGLPSRGVVQQALQNMLSGSGTDVNQVIQQQTSAAAGSVQNNPMNELQDRLGLLGGGSGGTNATLPNFTPNNQHTKAFGQRLEYGVDLQFGPNVNYLPSTANFGGTIGYKVSDKFSLGVGAAYCLGLGTGWNHIQLSNQSVGLRSYLRWQLHGGLFIQGGGEWNYVTPFAGLSQLKQYSLWQSSALMGIGKAYKISKKVSGNVVLLYDFLYDQHVPVTQPLVLRVGYSF